ncbi:Uncharacterised protein [Serratia quinivorans]|nr:Uncharacterised protein [Serratia quinivorans]
MLQTANGVKTDQIARQVKAGDLLIALLGDGITFDGPGADSVQRFQLVAGLEQGLALLDRLFPFDNVVELVQLMSIKSKRNTQLTDTAILTMDRTTTRLDTTNHAFFRDHRLRSFNN